MNQKEFKLLGRSINEPPTSPADAQLETFSNENRERNYLIEFNALNFTSLCPVTQQSDFAQIFIKYVPNEQCIESKSLKFYLQSFRNQKMFNEEIVNRILTDLSDACKPRLMEVKGIFVSRGGIGITAIAEYPNPDPERLLSKT